MRRSGGILRAHARGWGAAPLSARGIPSASCLSRRPHLAQTSRAIRRVPTVRKHTPGRMFSVPCTYCPADVSRWPHQRIGGGAGGWAQVPCVWNARCYLGCPRQRATELPCQAPSFALPCLTPCAPAINPLASPLLPRPGSGTPRRSDPPITSRKIPFRLRSGPATFGQARMSFAKLRSGNKPCELHLTTQPDPKRSRSCPGRSPPPRDSEPISSGRLRFRPGHRRRPGFD